MRDGIEQRRLQAFALLERPGLARTLKRILKFVIQTIYFLASGLCFYGAAAGACGKLSGGDGRHKEGKQRDPVIRIIDSQRAEWREKEKVKAHDAQQRSENGRLRSPTGRSPSATVVEFT